jgi:hypothetical protein
MSEQEIKPELDRSSPAGSSGLAKSGDTLPKYLDPAATMEVVQRYVEGERNRTRRILLWATSVFLFSALIVLAIFLGVGIYVLQNSRKASANANMALEQSAEYAMQMIDVSNRISTLDQMTRKVEKVIEKEDNSIAQRNRILKADLESFRKWVEANDSKGVIAISSVESRLVDIQKTVNEREKELNEIKERSATVLATVASFTNRLALPPVPVTVRAAPKETAPSVPVVVEEMPEPQVQAQVSAKRPVDVFAVPSEEPMVEPEAPDRPRRVAEVTFPDGDTYRGEFREGLFYGWGLYTYKNGDKYEGEFAEGMKCGKGTFTCKNGDKYVGEFKNDIKDGKGTFYYANGDRYVGEFANDMINGKGTMLLKDGTKYAGNFKNALKDGNGVLTFGNGDVYKGEFKEGVREGHGTYIYKDGSKYVGDFRNGQRDGQGRYVFPEGEEYVGEFKDGKKDGRGVCVYPNGIRINVVWANDQLMEENPE